MFRRAGDHNAADLSARQTDSHATNDPTPGSKSKHQRTKALDLRTGHEGALLLELPLARSDPFRSNPT